MSQSSLSYLMTQEFCYTALVITTCDFKRFTNVRKKHTEAAQRVGSFKAGSYFQAHALLSPGRGAEQMKTDHVKIIKMLRSKSSLLLCSHSVIFTEH